jgi:anaerobic selenocysteine-containing dehydrogenase
MTEKQTYCRLCEPACSLIAEVEESGITLRPDADHPVHGGFACHKGLKFTEVHTDPDRLDYPMKRTGPKNQAPQFERISWDMAADEIAARLGEVKAEHGDDVVGLYVGNPSAFNSTGRLASRQFARDIGVRYSFGSGTQDCANKFAASEAVFGTVNLHPIPDFENTSLFLDIGSNPRISHMSFIHMTDPMGSLRAIVARGGRVVHVNPRRTESVTPATGELVQIKPDTDVYLLAALLNAIHAENLADQASIDRYGANIDQLWSFVSQYPAERVADITGLSVGTITSLARDFANADGASVHASTGINMGRQGTLAYWLVQMLSFVTGNLGSKGGNVYSPGYFPAATVGLKRTEDPFFESDFGPLRRVTGSLPGNLLADYIETGKVKALVCMSGNPLLSMGGSDRLQRAFEKLDLLVVIDIYPNATAELADYALPATDWLERGDINSVAVGFQPKPYVQYVDAVVEPRAMRKPEWWIFSRLSQALGKPADLNQSEADLFARADRQLANQDLSLEKLKQAPSRTVVLPPVKPELLYELGVHGPDGKIDCCPALFADALNRCEEIFEELTDEAPDNFKLITLRTNYMMNSWLHNMPALKRDNALDNPLYMNPQDAEARGWSDNHELRVENEFGQLIATCKFDDRLKRGVVAMTHGWSQGRNPAMTTASNHPGVNVNNLLPTGPGSFEPLSNQSFMTGVPVSISSA